MAKTAVREPIPAKTTGEDLVGLYRLAVLCRRLEEVLYKKYREGKMGGYLHRYDGQEAAVVGVIPLLRLPGDYILCTYRDHAHALAADTDPKAVLAELMGRATGCVGGKGGSMHLIDPPRGFLGGDGIVGGPVPVSVGVGYALKYRGTDNICVCYFGDGAMNQGGVHEALNMVGLYKLPVLYILENNQYAMGTSISRSTGQPDFVLKARAHGIGGEAVDGMDVLRVREVADRAIRRIRETGEAYFLEIQTYRFVGHGIGDDNTQGQKFYRSDKEVEDWRKRDPLPRLRQELLDRKLLSEEKAERIEHEVTHEVEEAITFAEASPEPPLDSLYENVFS